MTSAPRPARRIALAAVLALAAGLVAAYQHSRSTPPRDAGGDAAAVADSNALVEQALDQIPAAVDSAELRVRWADEVRGVETTGLDEKQREVFIRFANAERCTCGCGFTLAACRASDLTCPVSLPMVESLLDSVRRGRIRSAAGVRERPRETPSHGG